MCVKCGKGSCSGGCQKTSTGKDLAAIKNELAALRDLVANIQDNTKALVGGHPMWMVQNNDDVALFDMTTGLGSAKWEGWALCNGASQYSNISAKFITMPNLLDKFVMSAGTTYPLDTVGGADTVTLNVTQIPAHAHTLNDPGHDHTIEDPGHTHAASSAAHTHTISTTPHTHTETSSGTHTHDKTFKVEVNADIDNTGGSSSYLVNDSGSADNSENMTVDPGGDHTHTIANATVAATAGNTSVAVTVTSAFTGISETEDNVTLITMNNTGGGLEHENKPPFYSVIYIMKL